MFLANSSFTSLFNNIYSQLENNQDEDVAYILKVLNDEIIEEDIISLFLQKQLNKILNIDDLKFVNVWDLVIKENKVEATWENAYQYYFEYDNSFNESINTFLNTRENFLNLGSSLIKVSTEKDKQNEFILKLLTNDNLTIESYSVIPKSIPKQYKITDKFDYNLINRAKVEKLIELNIIPLTLYHFKEIKSNYPGLQIKLLLRNWNNYLDFYKKYDTEIEINDIILLLQDSSLKEGLKNYIIKNQISDDDLLNEQLANEVSKLLIDSKNKIKDVDSLLNFDRLKNIFYNKLESNIEVRLINLIGNKLTKDEILTLKDLMPNHLVIYVLNLK